MLLVVVRWRISHQLIAIAGIVACAAVVIDHHEIAVAVVVANGGTADR